MFLNLERAYVPELFARGKKQRDNAAARAEFCGYGFGLLFMYVESRYASVPKASEPSFWYMERLSFIFSGVLTLLSPCSGGKFRKLLWRRRSPQRARRGTLARNRA